MIDYTTNYGVYEHAWEEDDLLIWDNLQVMHRACGFFEGRRLFHRVQTRMKFNKNIETNEVFEASELEDRRF